MPCSIFSLTGKGFHTRKWTPPPPPLDSQPTVCSSKKQTCVVPGCPERVAPTMWRSHLNQHASGLFPGNVPSDWLTQNGFFVCHLCHQLVSESHVASHNKKCKGSTLIQHFDDHSNGTPDYACAEATYLPSLDEIFALKVSTLTHIPHKSLPIFAQALSSGLRGCRT